MALAFAPSSPADPRLTSAPSYRGALILLAVPPCLSLEVKTVTTPCVSQPLGRSALRSGTRERLRYPLLDPQSLSHPPKLKTQRDGVVARAWGLGGSCARTSVLPHVRREVLSGVRG